MQWRPDCAEVLKFPSTIYSDHACYIFLFTTRSHDRNITLVRDIEHSAVVGVKNFLLIVSAKSAILYMLYLNADYGD